MCVCVCVYIYIYIVIHSQTVSLYHNTSMWLDTWDASNWDRNPADFRTVGYLTALLSANESGGILLHTYHFSFLYVCMLISN